MKKANALVLSSAVGMLAIAGVGLTFSTTTNAQAPLVTVSKSPTCGCCAEWVDHLRDNGFRVDVNNTHNMRSVKADAGVPYSLRSCHTATVEGYSVEGHVPAADMHQMLDESPNIGGIGVAGMPAGSPGMEMGARKDAFQVMAFGSGAVVGEFNKYTPASWW